MRTKTVNSRLRIRVEIEHDRSTRFHAWHLTDAVEPRAWDGTRRGHGWGWLVLECNYGECPARALVKRADIEFLVAQVSA
jgi:hypothetical protein